MSKPFWLGLTLTLAIGPQAVAADLRERLEIRRTQSGFAGEAGTLLVVERTGEWTRQLITRGEAEPVEPGNSGKLTADQLDRLTKTLGDSGFDNMPAKLGGNTRANPNKLTIRLGNKTVELLAPPAPPGAPVESGPQGQAEAIATTVEEMTSGR